MSIRCLAACVAALWLGGAGAAEPLRIAVIEDARLMAPFKALMDEAMARAGLRASYQPMPLRRAEQELLAGRLDGNLTRTTDFFEKWPQLLRVAVPLREQAYHAVQAQPCPPRLEWASLIQRPLTYQRGAVAIEALLPEPARRPAANLNEVGRYLREGVAERAIMPMSEGLAAALEELGLCVVAEPVLRRDLFVALHASQMDAKLKLEQALSALRAEGRLARHWAQAEAQWRRWTIHKPGRPASQ